MKKMTKLIKIGLFVLIGGLLVFGAVNRTLAKGIEEESSVAYNGTTDVDYGKGNGGNGNGYAGTNEVVLATPNPDENGVQNLGDNPDGSLDQNEIDGLLFMREEEKLARDVYTYLANVWGMPVFSNIASSEQTHMDSVLTLLNQYGLMDSTSSIAGEFNNSELQALYNQLIAQGSVSIEEALKVGAAIEEIDILDLQERIAQTDEADILQVYQNLEKGSKNHLNAFVSNLEGRTGLVYEPKYLTDDVYASILSESTGTGTGYGLGGQGNRGGNR